MSTTITIHLTESAQRAALLAREPAHTPQFYDVPEDLLARLLALPMARIADDGAVTCETGPNLTHRWDGALVSTTAAGVDARASARPTDAAAAIAHAEGAVARANADHAEKEAAKVAREAARQSELDAKRQAVLDADAALGLPEAHVVLADGRAALSPAAQHVWDLRTYDLQPLSLPVAEAAWALVNAHDVARDAARQAEREAKAEVWRAAARAYVIEHVPEYARAASEGCDVRHRATEHVQAQLAALGAAPTASDEPHTCPSAHAYAELDRLTAAVAALPGMEGAELEITRSDVNWRRGTPALYRTCIHIAHELPWGDDIDRAINTEPEGEEEDDS